MANDFTSQYLKERKKSGAEIPKSSDSRSFTEQYLSLRKSPDMSVTPGSLLGKEVFQEIPARVSTGETKREPKSRGGGFGAKESQGRGYFSQSNYSAKDRANDFLQGTLTGVAGSLGNAIGGVLDFADQAGREFLYNMLAIPEEELRERGADTPENLAATELLREIRDRENPVVEGIYDLADRGIQKGQAQYERSKVGMGPVSSTLMDVGRVGVEMGTDALAGALTGGTGLIPMVARSFGSGVSQARANGAEDEEALLAGAAQGGIDYLTERMFGVALPFSKVYGGGSLDDIVQNGISSAVTRFARTEAGQRALGGGLTLGASALTEGAEEFIADWMGWQLPRIIYDGEVATAEETLSNSLYDFLVGAITGGIGGAVTPATYHYRLPDSTAQTTENQATWNRPVSEPAEAPSNLDAMDEALGGGRADVQSLTPEQIQAWEKRDDIWIDAQDRAYQMDPESHISQRTYDSVRDRSINAFQFDHPELQPYYREAAEALIRDASLSINTPKSGRVVRGNQGKQYINEILSSPSLRSAMDQGLSRNEVIQAAENLIADHGQENYAAAKRLELVLDQMLSDGYTTVEGESVPANQEYIQLKESIPGYQEREPLPIWDMDEGRGRTDEELARDMLQVQKAATVLGENGSRALTAAYDRNIARNYSPEQVVEGFYQTYHAVMEGKNAPSVDLPEQVKIAAESSAHLDRTRSEQARYFGDNSGLVRDRNQKKARLSTQDSRRLDALGKALGVQIRFETAIDDGAGHAANAKYGDGVISLSLDAEDPVFTSVIHEAVHRIRETDPDAYTQLSDLVQTGMTDEAMGFSLGSRSQLYGTENRDSLTEELVADAFGRMVRGESLDKLVQDNRTVVQKVLDVIRDIITKIQNVLSGKNVSLTENQRAEFRDLEGRMGEMERTFREALERQQSREGGQESGETRFSLKSTDSQGRELTPEQQQFFRDSKVVDEDGNLLVVYHGTDADFTVFDRTKGRANMDIQGSFFSPWELDAEGYGGNVDAYYLNITNPADEATAYRALRRFQGQNGAGVKAREYLESQGYDGVNNSGEEYIAFSPEQIKRVDNLTPTSAPDIRYSLSNREQLDQYIQEYGAIPRGERPYREVQIPKRTSETQKVSQTVRTILEAQATPDEAVQSIEELVADGTLSYNPYSDRQAMTDAENMIRDKGYATALSDWTRSVRDGEVSKRLTAEGWALYNQAANAGDIQSAMTILTNMVEHQRNAAQALQATRILKKMSPESQLYGVQRSAQNLTRELKDKYGSDYPDIRIDEELATRFLEAKTDRERDQAMQDLYRDIGRQMPSRFIDKWNAWRYLAMLGNPRTHIRNIAGNAFFAPVVAAKNITATAIESAVSRVSGGQIGRTKGAVTPRDLDILTAAWNDFANSQDRILGGGKYSDSANANRYIQEGRRIFRNPILERARTANSQALDLEDTWFSKPHYAYALAQYAKANGITAEQIRSGKGLDAARAYAIREAQKATYRDTNAFSEMVSGWGRYRGDNKIRRVGSTVLEGILPFRKTPANILVRGVEYSPLGLLKGLTYDLAQVKRGNMEASTAIDNISSGLTGTGLLALGVYLAAEGLVRGTGGDDDSEREYEELQGHQAYSLELGDQSFTLDWLAPEALPFFVGVNLWEQTQAENEDVTLSAMLQAVQNITEPILEMSCLQSLNDVFDAVGYASSEDLGALPSILSSAATSYLTQGIPTIFGQAERTGQDVRMTTYTERNAFLTTDMQYTIGRASSRIPGWDYQQIPYIDAWGRTESSGTVGRRAVDNFLNPAYSSTIIESPMEAELERLYEQTGDTGVLPSRAVRYVTVNGERKDLTAEEYVRYARNKGQTAYNILTELTAGAAYQAATDDVKAEMVDLAYQYSNDTAKASVSSYKPDGWVAKAQAAEKMGITESQYISLYVQQKSIESLKDGDGETIPDSRGLQIMELVYSVKGLTDEQRQRLFEDFNVGKNVRHFNQTLVKNRLERMRKQ